MTDHLPQTDTNRHKQTQENSHQINNLNLPRRTHVSRHGNLIKALLISLFYLGEAEWNCMRGAESWHSSSTNSGWKQLGTDSRLCFPARIVITARQAAGVCVCARVSVRITIIVRKTAARASKQTHCGVRLRYIVEVIRVKKKKKNPQQSLTKWASPSAVGCWVTDQRVEHLGKQHQFPRNWILLETWESLLDRTKQNKNAQAGSKPPTVTDQPI